MDGLGQARNLPKPLVLFVNLIVRGGLAKVSPSKKKTMENIANELTIFLKWLMFIGVAMFVYATFKAFRSKG